MERGADADRQWRGANLRPFTDGVHRLLPRPGRLTRILVAAHPLISYHLLRCATMQYIRDIHADAAGKRPVISFEFFPPKTEEGDRALLEKHIPALMRLRPDYCS